MDKTFEEFGGCGLAVVQLISSFSWKSKFTSHLSSFMGEDEKEMYVKIGMCGLNSGIVNKSLILFILQLGGTNSFFVPVIKYHDQKQLMEEMVHFG